MYIKQNYRIYPTYEQEQLFSQWMGCGRVIWNKMIDLNNNTYKETLYLYLGVMIAVTERKETRGLTYQATVLYYAEIICFNKAQKTKHIPAPVIIVLPSSWKI